MADRKPLVQVAGQLQEIPADDVLVVPAIDAGVYKVGDVSNIGSGSAPWLFLGSLAITGSGASQQLVIQMFGGDWADEGITTYSIGSFGQTSSSTSISVRLINLAYEHSAGEIYYGAEFRAYRDAGNTKIDVYGRVAGDYIATGIMVYKRTSGELELIKTSVATLPTVGVTELTVNFGWMPTNTVASTLLVRNTTLPRSTLYDITDPTSVASIGYNGSRIAFPAKVQVPASTVDSASLRILQGVTPTAPGLGDVWSDGAYIYWRNTSAANRVLVQTAGLSTNAIPKAPGTGILADSLLSDTGTEVIQASGLHRLYNPSLTSNAIAFTGGSIASPDAVSAFVMRMDGTLSWGPGGATARDVALYRSAANVLKTDGNFDVGIDLRVAGTPRISAGGAATMATVSAANLTAGRVTFAGASGLLTDNASLTFDATTTRSLVVGSNIAQHSYVDISAGAGYNSALRMYSAGVLRWRPGLNSAVGYEILACDASGIAIDNPVSITNAAAGDILLGGTTGRPIVVAGSSRLRFATNLDFYKSGDSSGVHFKTPTSGTRAFLPETTVANDNAALGTPSYRWRGVYADVADFSGSLSTATAAVTGLTSGRMVSTTTGGALQALDAAASRELIGVQGADHIDRPLKSSYGAGWVKLCTLKVTAQNLSSQATIDLSSAGRNLTSDTSVVRAYCRIRQTSVMSSPLNIAQVQIVQQGGGSSSFVLGHVVDQDDASAKVVSVWVYCVSANDRIRYSVLSTWSDNAAGTPVFFENGTIETVEPVGYTPATWASLTAGAGSLSSLALSGVLDFGGDVNLYRGGVSLLRSDDILMTNGGFRATGYFDTAVDGTGPGVEVHYDAVNTRARVLAYDRTTAARIQLAIDGSPINFYANGTLKGSFNAAGDFSVVNLTAGRVLYTGASGLLTNSGKLTYSGGNVLVMGDGTADSSITLNKSDAGTGAFRFQVAGVERGAIGIDSSENFFWESKNSSGVVIDKPISWVNSAGGAMSIVRPLTVSAALTVTGTTTLATSLTGLLKATSGVVAAATAADVTGQLLTGYVVGANTALAATDSILGAFGKVQGQINARPTGTGSTDHVAVWSSASTLTHYTNFSFTTSVSNILNVGSNEAKSSYIDISTGTSNEAMNRYYANFVQRWGAGRNASNEYEISAYDFSGVLIDKPIVIANASAGLISIGGSTARPTTFSGLVTASAGLDVGTSSQSWIRNGGGGLYMGYGSDKDDYRFYCYGNTAGFASMSSGSHVAGVAATTVGGTSGLVTVYGDVLKVEYLAGTGTRALAVDQYGQLVAGSGGSNIQNLGLSPTYSSSMDGTQKVVFTVPSTTFTAEGQKIVSNFQFDTSYSAGASRTYEIYYGSKRVAKFTHSPGTSGVRATAKVTLFPIGIGASSVMHCAVEITANGTSTGIAALSDTDLDAYVLVYTSGNLSVATGYWTANNVNTGATASMSFRATGPTATNVGVEGPTAQFIG